MTDVTKTTVYLPTASPRSIGAVRLNRPDLSEQTDELLEGFGG